MGLITNALLNLVVFAALAVVGGFGSAWYMIEAGSRLSTRTYGAVGHLDRRRADPMPTPTRARTP